MLDYEAERQRRLKQQAETGSWTAAPEFQADSDRRMKEFDDAMEAKKQARLKAEAYAKTPVDGWAKFTAFLDRLPAGVPVPYKDLDKYRT